MVQLELAKAAADHLLAVALLGEGWAEALEQLADAAEAGGASLVRVQRDRSLAHLSSTNWAKVQDEVLASGTATSPRQYYPDHAFGKGFRVDHDLWPPDELTRDPYYQEFLRPHGVFFHAKLRLSADHGERLVLTLKRRLRLGAYSSDDIAALDSIIPELRTTVRIASRVLDAHASGMVKILHERGDPVFELDPLGRVHRVHGACSEECGLLVRNRRLFAVDRLAQPQLECAIAGVFTPPQTPRLAPITDRQGRRAFVHLAPVTGTARDVFLGTAAVAVVIQASPRAGSDGRLFDEVREAFGLTRREAEIACFLADGWSLSSIAERLRMSPGTVRNHLKQVFEKSGARRQGELIALLCKLKP